MSLGYRWQPVSYFPSVYAKNEWKVLGQAGEMSRRVCTLQLQVHLNPGRGQPCAPGTSSCSWQQHNILLGWPK